MKEQQIKTDKMRRTNMIFLLLVSITSLSFAQTDLKTEKITPKELSTWLTFDKGKSTIKGSELIIEETEGSDGYFLISPKKYSKDFTLNYKVKALSASTVLITLFSVVQEDENGAFKLPKDTATPREVWNWRSDMKHYNLTINNSSHGNKPFFFKNNSQLSKGFNERLPENIMKIEKWYQVEIGRKDNKLWFKLNGTKYFNVEDCNSLKGGRLIFRISGTTGKKTILAKAALKDIEIRY